MFKYYIEIVDTTTRKDEMYAMQSRWFETEKEAIEWFESSFDYLDGRFIPFVMTAEFYDEDEYDILASEDINSVKVRYKGDAAK